MKDRPPISRRFQLVWIAIIIASIAGISRVEFGRTQSSANTFVVLVRHYGINASEIERTITNVLENGIADIPGIKTMTGTSEFGQSRIRITLDGTTRPHTFSMLLRDRVDRAYAGWPESVQRPQIHSSSGLEEPVFIVAFTASQNNLPELRSLVETEVKPQIESLEGVGEVNLAGGGIREIHVELETDRSSRTGLTPATVGGFLQSRHVLLPAGILEDEKYERNILLDGHLKDLKAVRQLLLINEHQGQVPLSSVARVSYGFREPDDISRLNGQSTVTMYIQATGNANIVRLNRLLRERIQLLQNEGYTIQTVYDLGKELEDSIRNVLISVLTGMAAVALFLALALPSLTTIGHFILSLPLLGATTLSILSFWGIPVDQTILAGLAIGIGMMIDSALVIADDIHTGTFRFKRTASALIASTATTLIVFIPLVRANTSENIASLALAIVLLLSFSLVYYLVFLPTFLKPVNLVRDKTVVRPWLVRPPVRIITYCTRRPQIVLGITLVVVGIFVFCAIYLPRRIDKREIPGTMFARLEMESGASIDSVDRRSKAIMDRVTEHNSGIISVESRAKTGQCLLTVKFDPKQISLERLKSFLEESAKASGVFAYIPTDAVANETRIQFTLTGPDNILLRKMANDMTDKARSYHWVKSGVLHFKENPPAYVYVPDAEALQKSGMNVSTIAGLLKWSVQGPVAIKWLQNGEERDLRVFADRNEITGLNTLHALSLKSGTGERIRMDQVGKWVMDYEPSRITHYNRQRAVQFSLITEETNLKNIIALAEDFIEQSPLPSGYGLFYDRLLEEKRQDYITMWISLAAALILVYAVLAIQSESLIVPLVELSIIPVSLAFPLIVYSLVGLPLRISTLIGLIVLSGMAVNNAILVFSRFTENSKETIRSSVNTCAINAVITRYASLILTTGTTLLGTLPLILGRGSSFSVDMAFILALGLAGAFIATLTFYPSLLIVVFGTGVLYNPMATPAACPEETGRLP